MKEIISLDMDAHAFAFNLIVGLREKLFNIEASGSYRWRLNNEYGKGYAAGMLFAVGEIDRLLQNEFLRAPSLSQEDLCEYSAINSVR